MGDDLSVRMTGDAAALLAALQKVTVRLDQTAKAFKEVKNTAKEAAKEGEKVGNFQSDALSQIKSMAAGYLSVNAAIQIVNKSLQDKQELERKAARAQITLASARKEMIANIPGGKAADVKQALAAAGVVSRETGVDEKFIATAMAQALSTGGTLSQSQASVRQAARFLPHNPESIGDFAGSLIQLSTITGSDDARVNQGLLSFIGSLSPIVDPKLQAKNVPPAMMGAKAFGTQARDAAALFGAISTGAGDKLGATSGTGLVALSQQLEEFLPGRLTSAQKRDIAAAKEKQASGKDLSDVERQALDLETRAGLGLTDTAERIKVLQQNRDRADEFLAGASFEKTVLGPITELLTDPTSTTAKLYAANQKLLPNNAGLAQVGEQTIRNYALDPLEQNARLERAATQSEAEMLAGNVAAGTSGITREALDKLLASSGQAGLLGWFERTRNIWSYDLANEGGTLAASDEAIGTLTKRRNQLANPLDYSRLDDNFRLGAPREPTPAEQKQVEALDRVLDVLKEIRDANQGQREDAARRQAPAPVNAHAE